MAVEPTVIDRSVEAGGNERGWNCGSGLVLETDWLVLDIHRFSFSPPLDLCVSEG